MDKSNLKNKVVVQSEGECPDERMLGLFVERALDASQMALTAGHVIGCGRCKEIVKEHTKWLLDGQRLNPAEATDEERRIVHSVLKRRDQENLKSLWGGIFAAFKPTKCYLAAADGQTGDQIQQETAARSGFVHFVSTNPPAKCDAWHVKLAFPTVITDETRLRLLVLDFEEQPIKSGTLVFCGVDIDIADGYAYMPIKTFKENIGVSLIALKTVDGKTIPGEPVRAYEAGL